MSHFLRVEGERLKAKVLMLLRATLSVKSVFYKMKKEADFGEEEQIRKGWEGSKWGYEG